MFAPPKHNALILFFLRLGFIFILITSLGLGSIYGYYAYKQAQYMNELIETKLQTYTKQIQKMDSPEIRILLTGIEQQIQTEELLGIELSDGNGKQWLHRTSMSLPFHIKESFEHFDLASGEGESYRMLPLDGTHFVLIYAQSLHSSQIPDLRIKIAVPIPAKTVMEMRNRMREVFIGIAFVLLLVTAATFPIIYRQYRALQEGEERLLASNIDTILTLGNAIALRDSDTSDHNYRVTYYTIRIAEALQLPENAFPALITGALLHDIGKIGIPDAILRKAGPLDAAEMQQMQRHVDLGIQMLTPLSWLHDALPIVREHHERYDGSGYPLGLKGSDITLEARIFALADVFDALCSQRPYKDAYPFDACLSMLRDASGTHFDPVVHDAFRSIANELHHDVVSKSEADLILLLSSYLQRYWHALLNDNGMRMTAAEETLPRQPRLTFGDSLSK